MAQKDNKPAFVKRDAIVSGKVYVTILQRVIENFKRVNRQRVVDDLMNE